MATKKNRYADVKINVVGIENGTKENDSIVLKKLYEIILNSKANEEKGGING